MALRAGVVGLGHNGLAWCRAYRDSPSTELAAIWDLDADRLSKALEELGPGVEATEDIYTLPDLDIISIHTPDHVHAEPFVQALEGGKHVMVEKPMANCVADLERMVAAARASDRKTMVGQVLRFNPLFAQVRKLIEDGVLGEVYYLEGDYVHDLRYQQFMEPWKLDEEIPIVGGGVHPLDLLRWFAGDVVEAHGYANHVAYPEMQTPTTQAALFRFASGAIGKVAALYGPIGPMGSNYNLVVHGTKGTVRGNQLCLDGLHEFMEIPITYAGHPYDPQVEHFAKCIADDTEPLVPAIEGAKSAQACLLAHKSAIEGRPIPIPTL